MLFWLSYITGKGSLHTSVNQTIYLALPTTGLAFPDPVDSVEPCFALYTYTVQRVRPIQACHDVATSHI